MEPCILLLKVFAQLFSTEEKKLKTFIKLNVIWMAGSRDLLFLTSVNSISFPLEQQNSRESGFTHFTSSFSITGIRVWWRYTSGFNLSSPSLPAPLLSFDHGLITAATLQYRQNWDQTANSSYEVLDHTMKLLNHLDIVNIFNFQWGEVSSASSL